MNRKIICCIVGCLVLIFVGCQSTTKNEQEISEEVNINTTVSEEKEKTENEQEQSIDTDDEEELVNEYYTNEEGNLVDKVEQFREKTSNGHTIKYPILEDGVDEVVVYEFDTFDKKHIVLDATNVMQQVRLDRGGDYGNVYPEIIAPGKDVIYMFDGNRYYNEDYSRNLVTISEVFVDNNY